MKKIAFAVGLAACLVVGAASAQSNEELLKELLKTFPNL